MASAPPQIRQDKKRQEKQRHGSGSLGDFWERVTAGLELQELWSLFKAAAADSEARLLAHRLGIRLGNFG
jgi:hypothetical protein